MIGCAKALLVRGFSLRGFWKVLGKHPGIPPSEVRARLKPVTIKPVSRIFPRCGVRNFPHFLCFPALNFSLRGNSSDPCFSVVRGLVAHDCGYPLSRYTCRATRVAADFLDFTAFCRCSSGVTPHPLKILVSHLPPPFPGGVAPKSGSEKVSRYTGVSQVQLRVSRYTVQLR